MFLATSNPCIAFSNLLSFFFPLPGNLTSLYLYLYVERPAVGCCRATRNVRKALVSKMPFPENHSLHQDVVVYAIVSISEEGCFVNCNIIINISSNF